MSFVITIVAFLVAIGILVTIHELGHYWAARLCDVKVLRFSVGFGKPLWLRRYGPDKTEWVIAALPLGGYVKMADERDGTVEPYANSDVKARAFNNKTVWQRIFIAAAGPAANLILAALFYWVLLVTGMPGAKPYVAQAVPNTAAADAGFQEFERITRIDGREVVTWADARLLLVEAATNRGSVDVETENEAGNQRLRTLNMSGIGKDDLDKDFLGKLGLLPFQGRVSTVLDKVDSKSAADLAGLKVGDKLVALNGTEVAHWSEVLRVLRTSAEKPVALTVMRDGARMDIDVTPAKITEKGETFGRAGFAPVIDRTDLAKMNTTVRYGIFEAIPRAIGKVWEMSIFSLKMMGKMITGEVSWKNLSGPVTIADYAGQSAQMGWIQYVMFLALISISLGVLNLLPIPVLDGGQLLYYMIEIFKGSPVSERTMEIGQQVGLTLLLGLTAFAFYNDIQRLFST
jgi:regulator of sigma E protease